MDAVLSALRGRTAAAYAVSPLYRFGLDPRSRKLYSADLGQCVASFLSCERDRVECSIVYVRAGDIDGQSALPASCVVIDIYAPSASGREQHHTLALFARASDYDADSVAFFPCKLALCRAPRPLANVVFQWLERRFDARSSLSPLRLNPRTLFELSAAAMPDIVEASDSAPKQRGRLSRLRANAEFRFDMPHAIAARGLSAVTTSVPVKDLQLAVNAATAALATAEDGAPSPATVVQAYIRQRFRISIDCARLSRVSCGLWIADVSAVKVLEGDGWNTLLPALFAVAHPEATAAIETSAQVPVMVPPQDAEGKKGPGGEVVEREDEVEDSPPSQVAVATPRRNPKRRASHTPVADAAARRRLQ